MKAMATAEVDVVVLGGGIAGLWLLNRLRANGYSAVLLEPDRLGAGQSIAAQGIIHGGLKYARNLRLGAAAVAIGDMPALWRRCLAGRGEVDLAAAPPLAERHLIWLPPGLLGQAAGFFASRAVRSRAARLEPADWPTLLQGCPSVGAVYALDEPVVDVPGVLAALAAAAGEAVRGSTGPAPMTFERDASGAPLAVQVNDATGRPIRITARRFVFTAGAGNAAALASLHPPPLAAQHRPLQMVLVRGVPLPLYAHCFDLSDKPRLTVTSHRTRAGERVWYLGGQLAEVGAGLSRTALIARAKAELAALLPGLAQDGWRFATLPIDRAEAAQPGGKRPERPVLAGFGSALIAWPTKLAFAPLLAAEVLARLGAEGILPGDHPDTAALAALPIPAVADPPWERVTWD